MGQGLQTKLIQVCAHELGISVDKITCPPTSSYGIANGPFTGGSTGLDINGEAIRLACKEINARLAPLKIELAGKPMADICATAAQKGINLSGQGFRDQALWGVPMKDHSPLYYSWNVAVCEVELDVLTGHYRTVRSDIIQDVGQTVSPMIDIGQVEGGFIQGASFVSLEDLESLYGNDAIPNFTAESYEIYGFRDIPVDFRVELTPGIFNSKSVHSSKGIGEPTYSLGTGVVVALRHAIASARAEKGHNEFFTLNLPATRTRVVQALQGTTAPAAEGKQKNLEE